MTAPALVPEFDLIRVDRLFEQYDPFSVLAGLCQDEPSAEELQTGVDEAKPVSEFIDNLEDGRPNTLAWHAGRIRYFRDQFMAGKEVDPIILDNLFQGYSFAGIVLMDGHHRFAGAILAGVKEILCSYSGYMDVLSWLKGLEDEFPY